MVSTQKSIKYHDESEWCPGVDKAIVDREGVDFVEKYYIPQKDVEKGKKRFNAAVKRAMDELRGIIDNTPTVLHQQTNILEIHVVLLKDKML